MAAEDGRLFEPPPPVPQPAGGGGGLYKPPKVAVGNAGHDDNVRVRALYRDHITERAITRGTEVPREQAEGQERGAFVDELVALCEKEKVAYYRGRKPGAHAKGSKAARDSVATQLRQFWVGRQLPDYMLVCVEATIAYRAGMALPGGWYSLQRRMDV